MAQGLLQWLKADKLVPGWKKRRQSRMAVRLTIEAALDELPQAYSKDMFNKKCDLVYQHVFDSY